jgi:hypothetical protein
VSYLHLRRSGEKSISGKASNLPVNFIEHATLHVAPKPCLRISPHTAPEYPAHVPQGHNISLSLALPRAFAFWAILPIDAYDWLSSPANAGEPSIGYSPIVRGMLSVPKVHWFVALGRHFALRAFGNAGDRKGWISSMQGLDDPGLIPVWACVSTVCAGST